MGATMGFCCASRDGSEDLEQYKKYRELLAEVQELNASVQAFAPALYREECLKRGTGTLTKGQLLDVVRPYVARYTCEDRIARERTLWEIEQLCPQMVLVTEGTFQQCAQVVLANGKASLELRMSKIYRRPPGATARELPPAPELGIDRPSAPTPPQPPPFGGPDPLQGQVQDVQPFNIGAEASYPSELMKPQPQRAHPNDAQPSKIGAEASYPPEPMKPQPQRTHPNDARVAERHRQQEEMVTQPQRAHPNDAQPSKIGAEASYPPEPMKPQPQRTHPNDARVAERHRQQEEMMTQLQHLKELQQSRIDLVQRQQQLPRTMPALGPTEGFTATAPRSLSVLER